MRAVKGKGNKTTEQAVRLALVREGIDGWIMHPTHVPGKPDFFFPDANLAIFVDGCFWHGCARCGHIPKVNSSFWRAKIERNRKRDAATTKRLKADRVKVLRFWEHEISDGARRCVRKISSTIGITMTEQEKLAVQRVRRAGIKASETTILAWIRSVGPNAILFATLAEIRAVARAF
jgi:DNA mismatch endonuclease (patch repair protein)